jgi:hypothetical protein
VTNSPSKPIPHKPRPAAGAGSCRGGAADQRVQADPARFAAKTAAFRTRQNPRVLAKPRGARYQVAERFRGLAGRAAWSAAIAQLVEHVIRNDGVGGSNPSCGTSVCTRVFEFLKVEFAPMRCIDLRQKLVANRGLCNFRGR